MRLMVYSWDEGTLLPSVFVINWISLVEYFFSWLFIKIYKSRSCQSHKASADVWENAVGLSLLCRGSKLTTVSRILNLCEPRWPSGDTIANTAVFLLPHISSVFLTYTVLLRSEQHLILHSREASTKQSRNFQKKNKGFWAWVFNWIKHAWKCLRGVE